VCKAPGPLLQERPTHQEYFAPFYGHFPLHSLASQHFAVISPAEVKEQEETLRRRNMAAKLPEAEYIRAQIDEALERQLLWNASPSQAKRQDKCQASQPYANVA